MRVAVETHSRIERQPPDNLLAEIDITGHLVLRLVHERFPRTAVRRLVPRFASEPEVVHPDRQTVSPEQAHALVPRDARHVVPRIEAVVERTLPFGRMVSIVQPVPAPVIKETQGTGSAAVIVRQRNGSHTTRHPLVGIEQRVGDGTRIRRIEMRDIHIGPHVPVSRNLVSEFGITAVLLEPHVGTVAVRPVIRTAHDTRKPSTADTVGHLRLEGIIGAVTRPDMRPDTVLLHLARHDIDNAPHRIGTVQHGGRSAQHLHALGQKGLAGIRHGVTEQPHVLRMTVYQHEHTRRRDTLLCRSSDTAYRQLAGSAARHAVSHHAAAGSEQPRYLLRQYGQQRRFVGPLDGLPSDDRNGHRQMPYVRPVARSGHHHPFDCMGLPRCEGIPYRQGLLPRSHRRQQTQGTYQRNQSFHANHSEMRLSPRRTLRRGLL